MGAGSALETSPDGQGQMGNAWLGRTSPSVGVWPLRDLKMHPSSIRGFSRVSVVNYLPMQEMWVWSLGWEDPLKKEMATHSSILAWEIPMNRGVWWATVHGVAKSRTQPKD